MSEDPVFFLVMIAIGAGFFFTYVLEAMAIETHSRSLLMLARWIENYTVCDIRVFHGEIWRLVTCMFLHAGLDHLFGNMLFMVPLVLIARNWTRGHVWLGIFLAGGVAGSVLQLALYPEGTMVGASGGVAALAGAVIATGLRLLSTRRLAEVSIPLAFVVFYVVLEIFASIKSHDAHIAHMAHAGGLLAGLVLGKFAPLRK